MSKEESFCLKFWPLAADVGLRYGVNPCTILAVGAQEGGCGTSKNARVRRNHFGIGPHRTFATDAECFEFFGQLMARKYEPAALVSGNITAFVKRMAATNYVAMSPPAKQQWSRNVVAYWGRFKKMADKHSLQPAGPALATTQPAKQPGS